MKSSRPKPLHLLAGRTMLQYMLDSLADCRTGEVVVVVGHGAERVTKKLQAEEPDLHLTFVEQQGTGPLFYNTRSAQSAAADPLNPKQVPAAKTRARLG